MPAPPLADTPLGRTIAETATDIWNDSCAIDELEYAISFGAVGATANPTLTLAALALRTADKILREDLR